MTLRLLLVTYVIGGLTFLPLTALAVFAVLWYWSPIVETEKAKNDGKEQLDDSTLAKDGKRSLTEGAASTTFAVLRRYDFVTATAALRDASNAAEKSELGADGQHTEGVSVYQSMYRTMFDRNRNGVNPLHENEESDTQKNKARSVGKVFYIVLRHGHLMLYDSAVQFEVRHVISLAHYSISLQDDITSEASDFLESDIFTRRTAIVLTPLDKQSGKKPYFLFGDVNIEKEDFYHALLSSIASPPIPRALETESMIKLQSALHSNSLTPEARALNALLGRVFLALHRTPFLEAFIRRKIETKMARTPKPAFIASIACHSLDIGNAAPVLSNIRLKDINIGGETVIALDLKYTGGVNITLAAAAKLDLGPRFKTRMVSLLLAVVLRRLQGKMLIKIKPPPSNRIWFCFETMPDMELKIEPVVSSRQITYAFVLRAIEARIREVFAEGLVKPNWDDTPFFATEQQRWRGGIWESEGVEDVVHEEEAGEIVAEAHPLSLKNDKTSSMPILTPVSGSTATDAGDLTSIKHRSAANLMSQGAKTAADKAQSHLERPSAAITQSVRAPKSLRTPSFASPAAIVAVDDSSADALPTNAPATTPTRRRWIGRNAQAQAQKRDAVDAVRQVHDRDTLVRQNSSNEDLQAAILAEQAERAERGIDANKLIDDEEQTSTLSHGDRRLSLDESIPKSATLDLPRSETDMNGRHLRNVSTDSAVNTQRKTLLASTAAATAAARQWTWNAVANRAKGQQIFNRNAGQKQGSSTEDLPDGVSKNLMQQTLRKQGLPAGPIGRGQPLPPPGKPLPGPAQKGIWSAAAAGLGSMRRKPLPTQQPRFGNRGNASLTHPQQSLQSQQSAPAQDLPDSSLNSSQQDAAGVDSQHLANPEDEGEYGPWMANDLNEDTITDEDLLDLQHSDSHEEASEAFEGTSMPATTTEIANADPVKKKIPPPLPRRPLEEHPVEPKSPERAQDNHRVSDPPTSETTQQIDDDLTAHATSQNPMDDHMLSSSLPSRLETQPTAEAAQNYDHPTTTSLDPSTALEEAAAERIDASGGSMTQDSQDDLSDTEELPDLDDEVQAIPAPVDAEAEESGILNLAEDIVVPEETDETGAQQYGAESSTATKDMA